MGLGSDVTSGVTAGAALGGPVGAIAGGAVTGGLDLLGGLFQQSGQQASISQQEQFQQQESSSAYSRAVKDMKSAGLNPALMYGSGGPESSPGGASMTPPNVLAGVGSDVLSGANALTDIDTKRTQQLVNLTNAAKTSAQTPGIDIEADFFKAARPILQSIEKHFAPQVQTGANTATSGLDLLLGKGQSSARPTGPGSFKGPFGEDESGFLGTP